MKKFLVIDFDSTFTQVEALDVLCEITLEGKPEKNEVLEKIKSITDLGMEGKLNFRDSLQQRMNLLNSNQEDIKKLVSALKEKVSGSFKRNKEFLKEYADFVLILSNGFRDFIVPVVADYGIKPENVYANEFLYDKEGNIIGFNQDNLLSQEGGKPKVIESLNLDGEIIMIGDGYTDYQVREAGVANSFFAFTENVKRERVVDVADHIAPSLDEVLFVADFQNRAISYPKNRIKVLLLENVHPIGVELFEKEGFSVEVIKSALSEEELSEKIKDISFLGIRSKTNVTRKALENARKLLGIGAFCIGTNQIDLQVCTEKGIAVFNAPFSNTRSVVELAVGEMIMLIRNLPDVIAGMHHGRWNKSAKGSNEVRGKNLGILGYGNIGSQLSVVAEALGMNVYYFDLVERLGIGNARKCESLEELLAISDVISLHVDGRPENKEIIGKREFDLMKDGVIFMNLSRGHVVDIQALNEAIEHGKVRGASVDVFPVEPKNNKEEFTSELRGSKNTILTPHIGGSTAEAQENIGNFVPRKAIEFINNGSTTNSVNFPEVQLPVLHKAHRFLHIHKNAPGILAKINNVLASHEINIEGQYLKTNEEIGYVITDVSKEYGIEAIEELKAIGGTIRFRKLF